MGTQILMNSFNIINAIVITNALIKTDNVLHTAWDMFGALHFLPTRRTL